MLSVWKLSRIQGALAAAPVAILLWLTGSTAVQATGPTPTTTSPPPLADMMPAALRCSAGDELLWVSQPDGAIYHHDDARFAATEHGDYRCRSELPPTVSVAVLVKATPAPDVLDLSLLYAGAGAEAPPGLSCDCAAVQVFYATDRMRGASHDHVQYSGVRNPSNALSVGTALITIPRDHAMGNVERPEWWRFEFRENPNKHIVIRTVKESPPGDFYGTLSGDASTIGAKGEALVFVHGYNVRFDDALMRLAQLKYDLDFGGPAIAYSWPSAGERLAYAADENNALWTAPHFKSFLERLARTSGVTRIHVLAHSMGNRVVTDALADLSTAGRAIPNLENVIFAAPDVDHDVFLERFGRFGKTASHLVLYASSKDRALLISKQIHAGPRAGDVDPVIAAPGLETVDVSAVDTSLDGHGYYAGNTSIISDLFYVIRNVKAPRVRLRTVPARVPYWRFAP